MSKVPPLILRHHPYRARRPGTKAHHFLSKCHGGARPSSERSRKLADMCGRPLMELIKEDGHLPLYFPLETLPTSGPVKAQGSLAQIQTGAGGRGRIGGEGSLNLIQHGHPPPQSISDAPPNSEAAASRAVAQRPRGPYLISSPWARCQPAARRATGSW